MTEIHIGCGIAGIYAGKLRTYKDGHREWSGERTNVTEEAIGAVAQYFLDDQSTFTFEYKGKTYELGVREVDE